MSTTEAELQETPLGAAWRVTRLQAIVTHGGYKELSRIIVEALAAERKERERWEMESCIIARAVEQLEQKLSAERERVAMNEGIEDELREANQRYYDANAQLSAEREKVKMLVEAGKLMRRTMYIYDSVPSREWDNALAKVKENQ